MEHKLSNVSNESSLSKICNCYFQPKSFEKKVYEILGVNQYNKNFWKLTWGKLGRLLNIHNGNCIKGNSTESLEDYVADTKRGECWHLAYTLVVYALMGFTPEAHIVQTIGNYYPIMIQRYNRARVTDVIKKRSARKKPVSLK